MISIILAEKILSMFLILLTGLVMVRCKVLRPDEGRIISVTTLYLVIPCAIISAFQVEYTRELRNCLFTAMGLAVLVHIFFIALAWLLRRTIHMDEVEAASVIYTNAGNLVIPIVASVFGPEWVIYTSAFMTVQTILMWSHGKMLLCGEQGMDIRRMLLNTNMLATIAGLVMFLFRLRLTGPLEDAVSSIGSMLGPLSMIVTGILVGNSSWETIRAYRRLWLTVAIRLVLCPLGTILIIWAGGFAGMVPEGRTVMQIPFLAAMAPSASSITQMAQVYHKDAQYASAINVVSTVLCIVTMPLMVALYQAVIRQ